MQADIRREVERRFSPELLNRIEVVLFSPLTPDEACVIAAQYVGTIAAVLKKAGKTFDIDDDVLDAIVRLGHSPAYGARFLKRSLDERIKLPISTTCHETHFHVQVDNGEVVVHAERVAPAHAVA